MLGRRASVVQNLDEHLKTLRCTFAAYESARRGSVMQIEHG
jgi:hypothetical protein